MKGQGIFLCGILMLSACGADNETDTANKENLLGTWKTQCFVEDDSYVREQAVFTETTLSYSRFEYSDADCENADNEFKLVGEYKAGADASSATEVEGATPMDMVIKEVTMTLLSEGEVKFFNGESEDGPDSPICSESVKLNVAIDASKCSLGDDAPKAGTTWKTIFNATDTEVFFGYSNDDEESVDENGRDAVLEQKAMTKPE